MTGTLIRENPVLRYLPKWVIFSLVLATFTFNLFTFVAARSDTPPDELLAGMAPVWWLAVMTWLLIIAFLAFGDTHRRCSDFDMALPLTTRRLWVAHVAAVGCGAGGILLAGFAGVILGPLLTHSPLASAGDIAWSFGSMIPAIAVAALLVDLVRPNAQNGVAAGRGAMVAVAVTAGAVLLPVVLLAPRHPMLAAVAFALAVVIAWWRLTHLDPTFTVASRSRAQDAVSSWTTPARSGPVNSWWFVSGVVARATYRKIVAVVVGVPMVIVLAALLAGVDRRILDVDVRAAMAAITAYMLMALMIDPMKHFTALDAFPISRRRVFAVITLPWLVVVAAGYGVGSVVVASRSIDAVGLLQRDNGTFYTLVPLEFCELATNGNVPDNVAPWGEAHEAWSEALFRGAPMRVYSPFSVPEDASLDFAALQTSRAVEAVYGSSIPPEEIAARYLRKSPDGSVALSAETASIVGDYPGLRRRYAGPMFPVVLAAVALLWLGTLRVFLVTTRPEMSKALRAVVAVGSLAALMGLYLLLLAPAVAGFMPPWALSGSASIVVRHVSEAFPGAGLLVWAACVAAVAAAYLRVERRFARAPSVFLRGGTQSV